MREIDKIVSHIRSGETDRQRLGMEIEHFVFDENYRTIPFGELSGVIRTAASTKDWETMTEGPLTIGCRSKDYTVTLEPAGQFEISMKQCCRIEEIEAIYKEFRALFDPLLAEKGFAMVTCGVFPLVETGDMTAEELPLIEKQRYQIMNRYFQHTGSHGAYMMRATASTQISIDYSSEADCMRKVKLIEKLLPVLALITENPSTLGPGPEWKPYLLRMQIWNDVDPQRCTLLPGSLDPDYSYAGYADWVWRTPFILDDKNGVMTETGELSAAEYTDNMSETFVTHLLTMFFPDVRLKKYIEIRMGDSLPLSRMLGFAALIKGLMYSEKSLAALEGKLTHVTALDDIRSALREVMERGYRAEVYGAPMLEWIQYICGVAADALPDDEKHFIRKLYTLPVWEDLYRKQIVRIEDHRESGLKEITVKNASSLNYNGHVIDTMYLPKLFTKEETDLFENDMRLLSGIFKKIVRAYRKDASYRALFGFDPALEALILREKTYDEEIPVARADLFFDEETRTYRFCEFNTDGTSAMNEDLELRKALSHTKAFQEFSSSYGVSSFELFRSWCEAFLSDYREYARRTGRSLTPNIVIADFMEHATVPEFKVFRDCFIEMGCACEICDIRELTFDGTVCRTPSGMTVDAVYRRATTGDIMEHLGELDGFLAAVRADAFCLIGDLRTQIIHNKVLFRILSLPETAAFLTRREQVYIKSHVPATYLLTSEFIRTDKDLFDRILKEKDKWILKPEDSFSARGVYAGYELPEDEWHKILMENTDRNCILQEFCRPYRLPNISFEDEKPEWISASHLTGLFLYNGEFAGIYSRVSKTDMISTASKISLPTVVVS